jgi:hypothetical protein
VISDEDIDVLRRIADDLRHDAETTDYGLFMPEDPRDFFPDSECCSADELEKHARDCAAAERGEPFACGGYGIGTYVMRDPSTLKLAQDLDDWIDHVRNMETL